MIHTLIRAVIVVAAYGMCEDLERSKIPLRGYLAGLRQFYYEGGGFDDLRGHD